MSVLELKSPPSRPRRVAARNVAAHAWCRRCAEQGTQADGRISAISRLIGRLMARRPSAPCPVCELCAVYETDVFGL